MLSVLKFTPNMRVLGIGVVCFLASFVGGQNASSNNSRQMYLDPPNYMVGIVNENRVDCAGSFIKENFVVTSANCVYRKSRLSVAIESANPEDTTRLRPVIATFVHPYYRPSSPDYNIAVVKIEPFDDTDILILATKEPAAGQFLYTNGWDKSDKNQYFKSEVSSVVDRKICKNSLASNITITGKLICIGTDKSTLSFIEGSPASLVDENDNSKTLYGVATFSVKSSQGNLPNVYINIANFEINSFLTMFT